MEIKPIAYFLDELNSAGELIDREYNGIDQFSGGRSNGTPLYTQQQLEAMRIETLEKAAQMFEKRPNGPFTGQHAAAAIRSMK